MNVEFISELLCWIESDYNVPIEEAGEYKDERKRSYSAVSLISSNQTPYSSIYHHLESSFMQIMLLTL